MTKDQRIIADAIDFLGKHYQASLAMEKEYCEQYAQCVPDDCGLEQARAWEECIGAIVGFSGECERVLMRLVLLACGRTDEMLGGKAPVDLDNLKVLGNCSVRSRDFVATVCCDFGDDEARLGFTPIANHIEGEPDHDISPIFRLPRSMTAPSAN